MLEALILVALALPVSVIALRWIGSVRWSAGTRALRAELGAARVATAGAVVDFAELDGLPAPVQRFFRAVLTEGQPLLTGVHLRHVGTLNLSERGERWCAFTSDQLVVLRRPGFDWDARVRVLPGVQVGVHDAYIAGEGVLQASLFGALTFAKIRGAADIAIGELLRFFAESAWYPTALLPSQGVRWTAVDGASATATLTDGPLSVELRFTFHLAGPIDTVYAGARGRMVAGKLEPTPWLGRFWSFEERDGVTIPVDGEVSWILPTGPKPYWRGHMTDCAFDYAQ